jgi:hypothetical protein
VILLSGKCNLQWERRWLYRGIAVFIIAILISAANKFQSISPAVSSFFCSVHGLASAKIPVIARITLRAHAQCEAWLT